MSEKNTATNGAAHCQTTAVRSSRRRVNDKAMDDPMSTRARLRSVFTFRAYVSEAYA